jgi:hypothetical protein
VPQRHAIRLSVPGPGRILPHERRFGAFREWEGTMRVWGRLTGLVAGALLIATQASAQGAWPGGPGSTSPLVPGQLFVGFGAQLGTYNLPTFDSPWRTSSVTGGDLFRPSIDPDPTVAGPGGVVGYVFRDGTFPAWAGRKVRLSFGAQFWDGNFSDRQNRVAPGLSGRISAAPIDGSLGTQSIFIGWSQRQTSFNLDANGYALSLRLTSDFAVAPRVTLSPFVALFGGQSRESYSIRARVTGSTTDLRPYALDERVSTARVGAMLGTGVTVRVVRRVSLHLGARAGFVWMRSHMTGGDCFASTIVALGTPCGGAPLGSGFQTTVSDTRSTVGFRGGLTGGVSLDMTFAILSLTGFMTYDSHVPGIANPVVTSPVTTVGTNNQPTSGRAHIFFDDALDFGGMVVLRIPLDAPHG